MFGFGHVDAAEVAFGEHGTFGAQSAQIVVAEVVPDEFGFSPDCFGVSHAVSRVER